MRKQNFDLYLNKLKAYYWDKWVLPTFNTMRELMWINSWDWVTRFFSKLIEEWYLEKESPKKYNPTNKLTSFDLYSSVSCWVACEIDCEPIKTINIDKHIIGLNPNGVILVEVKWESMLDAWIQEWDIVSLDTKNKNPISWDIVIASVDWNNDFTLKRYMKDKSWSAYLKYENENKYKWEIIKANYSINIVWVVKWLIRKF